jgi:hypothetical protein
VADHIFAFRAADSEADAGKLIGAETGDNGLHAVVSAGGAAFPEAEFSLGQIHIVVNHQDFGGLDFVKLAHRGYAATAKVHERLGF